MQDTADLALDNFAQTCWIQKERIKYQYLPHSAFFLTHLLKQLLDLFSAIQDWASLDTLLGDWKYLREDDNTLWVLVKTLNELFNAKHL